MYYMIDNYDSFVYNLRAYMEENGQEVLVRRADEVRFEEIDSMDLEGIIISPGPKRPEDAIISNQILDRYQNLVPILGVCLGHQIIGHYYGAKVCHGKVPVHGKISKIHHNNTGVFTGLPETYDVTRYHSLVVSDEKLPSFLKVTAKTEDGVIMGISHVKYPVYGIQFHPEAVLTEYGHELLYNFHNICKEWKKEERRAV
ncbi:anthranilate synthase component 2/para-aminobenzoate synthetase component 2 [Acetitomaculum ruminis DSM 5522]|uniref:Anthranilate synthase component 2/para-aminobenzoate synthetase component 2 n=1 Tax=Acetitomaculum ruminis DSM 5522 TaxID=1120918 RepID=A0A1I0ZLL2_9FIRM|nr:aminodeoxychorismate/anthranilate synthase component II [Acetitomaculum ruminis]SFB26357.1 anthranilate synthase component 2/para-aminobenzoate synthetase component 2 [Acetitomaculum ruminis DSM 5522]